MRLSFPKKCGCPTSVQNQLGTEPKSVTSSGGEHGGEGQEGVGGGDQGQVQGGRQGGEQVHLRDLHMRVNFMLHNSYRARGVFIQVTILYVGIVDVLKWFCTPTASSKIEMSLSMWLCKNRK